MDLTRIRLAKGDSKGAAETVAEISDPEVLAKMRVDKRFDSVVRSAPSHFDISRALEDRLSKLKALSAAKPDKLAGINAVAFHLVLMGRPADALKLVDDALARDQASGGGKSPFGDRDKLNWTEDTRTRALARLGRYDEALAQLSKAARLTEDGNVNVSQSINLGSYYDEAGRPKEALDAVASLSLDSASPFGRMQLVGVRACAYSQLHDDANLRKTLDYLKEHTTDAVGTYGETLICAGDLDGAARDYISLLDAPDSRSDMLYNLQRFQQPDYVPPFRRTMNQRLDALRERPDIRAAIDKYGRIESLPIVPFL
jgi:tetratricopeptide (TPR) repeat protein